MSAQHQSIPTAPDPLREAILASGNDLASGPDIWPQPPACWYLDPSARSLSDEVAEVWSPPKRYTLSEWVEDENIILSPEYSARSGPVKLFGWQREPFDAFTDPYVRGIVLCVGVQMIKTFLIQSALVYIIKNDPGPVLLVQPTEDDGKEFSKERLTPMIRDCPPLSGIITDSIHDSKNTILSKTFPGGRLSIVSSQKPGNLARRSIRYLFCDEIDKYPISAGKEGNPRDLAKGRLTTFGTRAKWIEACSPTTESESAIWQAYERSDMRKPWVKCPKCAHPQILNFRKGVVIDMTLKDPVKIAHSAYYQCEKSTCKHHWTDNERWSACQSLTWIAEKPFNGIAGFWISHLYSPWKKISDIVEHFLRVKDKPQELKVFVNTVLAEPWREKGETPDTQIIYSRRESYPHTERAVIPQRGLFLTAATDVQDNPPRLECEVVAWGRDRENWSVGYWVIEDTVDGEPVPVTSKRLWDRLDKEILQREFRHESGEFLSIFAMAIDTGSRPKPVYEFAAKHTRIAYGPAGARIYALKTVVPVKGNNDPLKIISSISKEDALRKRQGIRIIGVGTLCAKQEIFDALKFQRPSLNPKVPVAGAYHFPYYELSYFEGLCSESRVVDIKTGKVKYEKIRERNEPIDLKVYNRAMASMLGIDRMKEVQWKELERAVMPINGQRPSEDLLEDLSGDHPPDRELPDEDIVIGDEPVMVDEQADLTEAEDNEEQARQTSPAAAVEVVKPRPKPVNRHADDDWFGGRFGKGWL